MKLVPPSKRPKPQPIMLNDISALLGEVSSLSFGIGVAVGLFVGAMEKARRSNIKDEKSFIIDAEGVACTALTTLAEHYDYDILPLPNYHGVEQGTPAPGYEGMWVFVFTPKEKKADLSAIDAPR